MSATSRLAVCRRIVNRRRLDGYASRQYLHALSRSSTSSFEKGSTGAT